jgi:hypothetical protein
MNKIALFSLFLTSILFVSFAYAKPAPSHAIDIVVINKCATPITFHVDNNWGSMYTGNHNLAADGSKDDQGNPIDRAGLIFSSNNDEEFYTVSYQSATCKVDYPMIRDKWTIDAIISGCDTTPKCELR